MSIRFDYVDKIKIYQASRNCLYLFMNYAVDNLGFMCTFAGPNFSF
jgi:hypothetical protein